ncbi:MAG TPA: right-handed parallel beta-helix repeat-containing protein [Planctomycetota bacterium]|nr:right-handed parallel beta-helix repeat-containing protein [Planctomycetota bacterium]
MSHRVNRIAMLSVGCLLLWGAATYAVQIADVELELPTFHCLGVRCFVTGDTGESEEVRLEYRKAGAGEWKRALDLLRVEHEFLKGVTVPEGRQLYAGSVFDLAEDTDYELRVTAGGASRVLKAKTWKEPEAPKPLRTLYVVPGAGGGAGTRGNPFRGIGAADAVAAPGDLILLAQGVYPGCVTLKKSGTEEHPIVWRGPAGGGAVIDGEGKSPVVSAHGLAHVMFEDLTIRNGSWGMVAHKASHITVRRCLFTKIERGFTSTQYPSRRHVIVDCVFEGPSPWPRAKGIEDTEGVQIIGEGHVVAWNRFSEFGDAISIYRAPGHAIDFYNNDISECTDDGIEMDYGCVNTRCFRNRLTNCFQGISVQPLYGGPCYIFRNVQYNVGLEILKMHNEPSGFYYLHNTSVKSGMALTLYAGSPTHNSVFRNNLFVGTHAPYLLESTSRMVKCDWDYDGFAGTGANFAKWNGRKYASIEELGMMGGIEKHGVVVSPAGLFASGILPPKDVKTQFKPEVNDLRLKTGSNAVDAGLVLPNVNDGFRGNAPDLGAYELGDPLPHYGPRKGK